MLIVAGLGNPDSKYLKTRHNVGFILLDELIKNYKLKLSYEKYKSYCAEIKIRKHKVLLLKPYTYMNLSGQAIKACLNANFIEELSNNLIVIHDDIDIEFGKIKVKNNGSDAGHNGIKNIIYELNTQQFIRIRVGIGKPLYKNQNFVLEPFSQDEYTFLISDISKKVDSFINQFLEIGYSKSKSLLSI